MTGAPWYLRWTNARDDQLRALAADGLSCVQISRKIGHTSKNAVIGRAARIGVKFKNASHRYSKRKRESQNEICAKDISAVKQIKSARSHKKRANGTFAHSSIPQRINNKAKREAEPIKAVPENASLAEFNAAIPPWQWVTIIDLTENVCHWHLWGDETGGERFYCGGAIDAGSRVYCHGHASFATAGHSRSYGFTQSIYKFR